MTICISITIVIIVFQSHRRSRSDPDLQPEVESPKTNDINNNTNNDKQTGRN